MYLITAPIDVGVVEEDRVREPDKWIERRKVSKTRIVKYYLINVQLKIFSNGRNLFIFI